MRVHYANGKFAMIDGPFAETKELIAGFCLIQAESKEDAIDWAKRMPFQEGEVEVRPLFELADFPVDPAEKPEGWRQKEEQIRADTPSRKPGTLRYLGIVKADKGTEAGVLPDEKSLATMGAFVEEGVKAGVFLSGEGLQPSSKGARIRYSGRHAHGDRRTLRRDQGTDRRLCDPPVQVEVRGDRMDQTVRAG